MRRKVHRIIAAVGLLLVICIPMLFTSCISTIESRESALIGKKIKDKLDNGKTKGIEGKIVFIDAGHGGKDPGTSIDNLFEKDITFDIAMKLSELLQENGAKVILTRSDDSFHSVLNRAAIINKFLLEREKERVLSPNFVQRKINNIEDAYFASNNLSKPILEVMSRQQILSDIENKLSLIDEYILNPDKNEKEGIFAKSPTVNYEGGFANTELAEIFDFTRKFYEKDMIFVSIHINNYDPKHRKQRDQTVVSGIQVYYRDNDKEKYKENPNYYGNYNVELRRLLAMDITQGLNKDTPFSQRWNDIFTEDYGVLRETNLPSVLVEAGFINNPEDRNFLKMEETRNRIAEGMQRGIIKYFEEINNPIK